MGFCWKKYHTEQTAQICSIIFLLKTVHKVYQVSQKKLGAQSSNFFVVMFVYSIIAHEPLDLFASNFDLGTPKEPRECTWLGFKF